MKLDDFIRRSQNLAGRLSRSLRQYDSLRKIYAECHFGIYVAVIQGKIGVIIMIEDTIIHPETGETLYRDVRPNEFRYKSESITLDMPGWYQLNGDDAIFSQEDMAVHDKALKILKARVKARENNFALGNVAFA